MLSLPVLLYTQISIHAPRTGSDPQGRRPRWSAHHISIHAPRTGSDTAPHQQTRRHPAFQSTLPARGATIPHCCLLPRNGFQSTLPARGATCATAFSIVLTVYFNPRSPHGERPPGRAFFSPPGYFNPRSPHGERQQETQGWTLASLFQSTLPARGATMRKNCYCWNCFISIHAPRTGSDHFRHALQADQRHFNPRSPHGERPFFSSNLLEWHTFQSTLPARGATLEDQ